MKVSSKQLDRIRTTPDQAVVKAAGLLNDGVTKAHSAGGSVAETVEFQLMPIADGRWYWEVITAGTTVIARGVADTKPAASRQAREAARRAQLIQ